MRFAPSFRSPRPSRLSALLLAATLILTPLLLTACSSWGNTAKGAAVGAAVGGAVGAVIGNETGSTTRGVLIGAAIGGAAGAVIGSQMDDTAEKLEKNLENATVERVGEGILVTFDSGLLFDFDSADLRAVAGEQLDDLSDALLEIPDTDVLVVGHTDSVGAEAYNQNLSQERAESAARQLVQGGVSPSRIIVESRGEMEPIDTNETDAGRQANRRVEVAIYASEEYRAEVQKEVGNI